MCTDADSSLVASGGVAFNGFLQVCEGTTVNIICSHNSTETITGWDIAFTNFKSCFMASNLATSQFSSFCQSFRIFNMPSVSGQQMSTLELSVDQSLNNAVVTCVAGGTRSDPQVGRYTIRVIGESYSC